MPHLLRTAGRLLTAVAVVAPGPVARAACVDGASTARLVVVMEDAEAAFARLDLDGFQAAVDEGAALVPCLEATLSRAQVARYHRLQGLRAWLVRDTERSQRAFLAARTIEPAWRFPVELVPEQHPTRAAYMALPLEELSMQAVEVPEGARLYVDGRVAQERPGNLPSLLQLEDGEGALRWSVYAGPGEALPAWPAGLDGTGEAPAWRMPLVVGSVGSALASGVLLGLAATSAARYEDPQTPLSSLDGLRNRTNGLLVASAVTGGLAVGGAVGVAWSFR